MAPGAPWAPWAAAVLATHQVGSDTLCIQCGTLPATAPLPLSVLRASAERGRSTSAHASSRPRPHADATVAPSRGPRCGRCLQRGMPAVGRHAALRALAAMRCDTCTCRTIATASAAVTPLALGAIDYYYNLTAVRVVHSRRPQRRYWWFGQSGNRSPV